jgi:hypothetical protein
VIKYAHDPLRFEPINVGVVLWPIGDPRGAQWRFDSTLKRVERLYPSANPRAVWAALDAYKRAVEHAPGLLQSGPGGQGTLLITEPRGVHCAEMEVELGDLYETMVAPSEVDAEEPREMHRSTRFVRARMKEIFKRIGADALSADESQKLRIIRCKSGVKHTFDFAYRNGTIHRVDALSFDHGSAAERINRARSFANLVGDVTSSQEWNDGTITAVVQRPTDPVAVEAYEEAKKILDTVPQIDRREVLTDDDLAKFCLETKSQLHG